MVLEIPGNSDCGFPVHGNIFFGSTVIIVRISNQNLSLLVLSVHASEIDFL